ncbi:uncharacterized protein TNCV_488911 [Trichonephila clavipes]|nr:uncharacterized protein TNCV_488911 [Trichonephila clavipes]
MACDAEDCGFQMLKDDKIVVSVREESDPVDDEADEDKDNNNKQVADVRFHILHGSHSVFDYPNNCVSEWCPVPIDSDKRRSTVYDSIFLSDNSRKMK